MPAKKILVVAAHPDDEVLGCGGTIAKFVKEGAEVFCCILGEGPLSRYTDRQAGRAQHDVMGVKLFTQHAARVLGITRVFPFQFPDNQFDAVSLLEIVRAVTTVKEEIKPTIIFTHSRADLNIDHRLTYQAVLTACRPMEDETVHDLYSFEIPSSTEWNAPFSFSPNMFVEVSATLGTKIQAFKQYETEVRPFPHPRSEEVLRAMATRWGSVAGLKAAEAFEVIRLIR